MNDGARTRTGLSVIMTVGGAWVEVPTACSAGFAGPRSLCSGKPMEGRGKDSTQRKCCWTKCHKTGPVPSGRGYQLSFLSALIAWHNSPLHSSLAYCYKPWSKQKGRKSSYPQVVTIYLPGVLCSSNAGEASLSHRHPVERQYHAHHVVPRSSQWVMDLLPTVTYSTKASSARDPKVARIPLHASISRLSRVSFSHDVPGTRFARLIEIREVCGMG